MSGLNKPTIEGLVEKLLTDNHIRTDEAETVQNMLQSATKGMTKEEISLVVGTLSSKIDAASNDLITPQGLNHAGFENVLKETTQRIVKEKIIREEAEVQAKKQIEKELEAAQIEALEIQKKVEENKDFLEDIFTNTPELAALKVSKEVKQKIAETMADPKTDKCFELYAMYKEQGLSDDEAFKRAQKESGSTASKADVMAAGNAILLKSTDERMKSGKSEREALEEVAKEKPSIVKVVSGSEEQFIAGGRKGLIDRFLEHVTEMQIEGNESKINTLTYQSTRANVLEIKKHIIKWQEKKFELYEKTRLEREEQDQILTPEEIEKRNEFYEDLVNEYLTTTKTFSMLYEKFKDDPMLEDVEFEEFFDRMLGNIKNGMKKEGFTPEEIRIKTGVISAQEKNFRVHELLKTQFIKAKRNLDESKTSENLSYKINKTKFGNENLNYNSGRNNLKDTTKAVIAQKRNIDIEKHKAKFKQIENEQTTNSAEKSYQRRNSVINDRKQVKRIAEEKNIEYQEAAEIYFKENPDALKNYSKKEKKILLGKNKGDAIKSKIANTKVLTAFRNVIKGYNNTTLQTNNVELRAQKARIKVLEQEGYDPLNLYEALQKADNAKNKIRNAEKWKRRLDKSGKRKTARDVLENRKQKEIQAAIIKEYLEGKTTVAEIYRNLEKTENGQEYSFNEVLDIVVGGVKKYSTASEVSKLRDAEKNIHKTMLRREAYQMSIKSARIKSGWEATNIVDYEAQIQSANRNININENQAQKIVNKIALRKKQKVDDEGLEEDVIKPTEEMPKEDFDHHSHPEVASIQTKKPMEINYVALAKNKHLTNTHVKNTYDELQNYRNSRDDKQSQQGDGSVQDQTISGEELSQ